MTVTVEELRRKYPEPMKTPETQSPEGTYCVGGALALEMGFTQAAGHGGIGGGGSAFVGRGNTSTAGLDMLVSPDAERCGMFPDPNVMAAILRMANPALTLEAAFAFAETIARKNDTGNFETAWRLLGDALTWSEEWTEADSDAMREWANA